MTTFAVVKKKIVMENDRNTAKEQNKVFRIAIDGPGGAGKSTVAKLVANRLGMEYVDTGAMYRALALLCVEHIKRSYDKRHCIGCSEVKSSNIGEFSTQSDFDIEAAVISDGELKDIISNAEIFIKGGNVFLNGTDVSRAIRTEEISAAASSLSRLGIIREKLGKIQKHIAAHNDVVMDGRDIGTNIIKDAELKIFLIASPEIRAKRRCEQLMAAGQDKDFSDVLADIKDRDYKDINRELNPLVRADDAIEVDSSDMSAEEVADFIVTMAKEIRVNTKSIE